MLQPPPHIDATFTVGPDGTVRMGNPCRFVLEGAAPFKNNGHLWRYFVIPLASAPDYVDTVLGEPTGSVAVVQTGKDRILVVEANRVAGTTVIRRGTDAGGAFMFRLLFAGPKHKSDVDLMDVPWFNPAEPIAGQLLDPSSGASYESALDAYDKKLSELGTYDDTLAATAMAYALTLAHLSMGMPDFPERWSVDEARLAQVLDGRAFFADRPGVAAATVTEIFQRLEGLNTARR